MEKKREWDREVFLSSDPLYHCFFGIGDGKGELLKLLLDRGSSFTNYCNPLSARFAPSSLVLAVLKQVNLPVR
jgi:hypothetical protein